MTSITKNQRFTGYAQIPLFCQSRNCVPHIAGLPKGGERRTRLLSTPPRNQPDNLLTGDTVCDPGQHQTGAGNENNPEYPFHRIALPIPPGFRKKTVYPMYQQVTRALQKSSYPRPRGLRPRSAPAATATPAVRSSLKRLFPDPGEHAVIHYRNCTPSPSGGPWWRRRGSFFSLIRISAERQQARYISPNSQK